MAFNAIKARDFVKSVDLSGTPRFAVVAQDATTQAGEVFDAAKTQAQVVGSALLSFSQGVTAETREAISDSALLAQLVANKRASGQGAPTQWYAEYVAVLQNVGWVLQASEWNDYTTQGTAGEVHQKIIEVLSVALGPSVAALAIIKAAIGALQAMSPDSPWMTIFSRESQRARIARFQIGLVELGEADQVFVSLLGCLIEAQASITQVLFFKFKNEHASFKASSSRVSINRPALADLGPVIRSKVRAYQVDYLGNIRDL